MKLEPINPESLGAPKGYSNGILCPAGGRLLFVAGQIAWDQQQKFVAATFGAQFRRALANVVAVVAEAGGQADQIASMRIYVTDKRLYLAELKEVGAAYREFMGKHFPAMALVEVRGLLEDQALVEIEATAVI
ncbi:MAG: RidA family protein [Vulcanimicrobiota bacterium]